MMMHENRQPSSFPVLQKSPPSSSAVRPLKEWEHASRRVGILALLALCLALGTAYQNGQVLAAYIVHSTTKGHTYQDHDMFDFDGAYQLAYNDVIEDAKTSCKRGTHANDATCFERRRVNIASFKQKSKGGLTDNDRELIADLYYGVDSVFEFGIGESTVLAATTNLPRYAGVDSSAEWISMARSNAPHRFRFYFADIGPTKEWGNPVVNGTLAKMALDYQIAPLHSERDPFDVYFVDGRWRVACVMASFLHAMQSGGDMNKIRVVLHDYDMREVSYGIVESIATIEQRSEKAIVLALKDGVTRADIFNLWKVGEP